VLPPEMVEEEEARKEQLLAARAARAREPAALAPEPKAVVAPAPAAAATPKQPEPARVAPAPAAAAPDAGAEEAVADEWGWDDEDDEDENEEVDHAPPFTESTQVEMAANELGLAPLTKLPTMEEIKARAAMSGSVRITTAGNPFVDPLGMGTVVGEGGAFPQTMASRLTGNAGEDEEEEEEEDFFADMAPTVVPAKRVVVDVDREKAAARSRLALQYTEDDDETEDNFGWDDANDDDTTVAGADSKEKKPQASKLSGVDFTFEESDDDLADLDDMDFDDL